MKKNIILLSSVLMHTLSTYGQGGDHFSDDRLFRGAIELGFNASTVNGDLRTGYGHFGINAGAKVFSKFSTQRNWIGSFGLMYSEKGAITSIRKSGPIGDYLETYEIHNNYVQLPIGIHYLLSKQWMFGAGIAFNYLLSHKESYIDYDGVFDMTNLPGLKFQNTTFDLRISAKWLFSERWMLNATYEYGLSPIRLYSNSFGMHLSDRNQYNELFNFSLIYLF